MRGPSATAKLLARCICTACSGAERVLNYNHLASYRRAITAVRQPRQHQSATLRYQVSLQRCNYRWTSGMASTSVPRRLRVFVLVALIVIAESSASPLMSSEEQTRIDDGLALSRRQLDHMQPGQLQLNVGLCLDFPCRSLWPPYVIGGHYIFAL